jgi:hypothetical protein
VQRIPLPGTPHSIEQAFNDDYVDTSNSVQLILDQIRSYVKDYGTDSEWIAPYTSLVTSSNVGKSRLCKEIAQHFPSIYLCSRNGPGGVDPTTGYPLPTPGLVDWLQLGVTGQLIQSPNPSRYLDDVDHCLAVFQWTSIILNIVREMVKWIKDKKFLNIDGSGIQPATLFQFFAQHPKAKQISSFFDTVKKHVTHEINEMFDPDGQRAHYYFRDILTSDENPNAAAGFSPSQKGELRFSKEVLDEFQSLKKVLGEHGCRWDAEIPFILFIDEARLLTALESYDGKICCDGIDVASETLLNHDHSISPFSTFCHLRAFRRALNYIGRISKGEYPLFAILTDTTSRVANFQPPRSLEHTRKGTRPSIGGTRQFEPIYVFESIDIFSVDSQDVCTSSLSDVSNEDRLLRFGRAGWYALAKQSLPIHHAGVRNFVQQKLLCCDPGKFGEIFRSRTFMSQHQLDQLLAVLASRLALTIGPSTRESSDLVASHLAIPTSIDEDRHFIRTAYPSEPVLAEASAKLTGEYGWFQPIRALSHFIRSGIVEAGFRGELLTKLICLMAMDRALKAEEFPSRTFTYFHPITVRRFLDHLISGDGERTFTETLVPYPSKPFNRGESLGKKLTECLEKERNGYHLVDVSSEGLKRLLGGYVFFNHWIRTEVKVNYPMLAQAWNRAAAFALRSNEVGIDFVIPIMLDVDVEFGPLHEPWSLDQFALAEKHMSYILINAKNYSSPIDHTYAALGTRFREENFRSFGESTDDEIDLNESPSECKAAAKGGTRTGDDRLFLSIVPDFGPKLQRENWISAGPRFPNHGYRTSTQRSPHKTGNQLYVLLKGSDSKTYQCLKADAQTDETNMLEAVRHIKEMVRARVHYALEGKPAVNISKANLPLVFGELERRKKLDKQDTDAREDRMELD